MKTNLIKYVFSLLMLLLLWGTSIPTYAQQNLTPTTWLNQLTYRHIHTPFEKDEMLYISVEDLSHMTYASYTIDADKLQLTLQQSHLSFSKDSRFFYIDGALQLLSHPCLVQDEVFFLPINCLDFVVYPYDYDAVTKQLTIESMMPYTSKQDLYTTHTTLETSAKSLAALFPVLSPPTGLNTLLNEAIQKKQYLSFPNTQFKKEALAAMSVLEVPSTMHVYFRRLYGATSKMQVGDLYRLPLTYQVTSDGLSLQMGTNTKSYNFFWATYNPSAHTTAIDVHKSLDVMLMRSIYETYRDLFDLKDDVDTSPLIKVQMATCDAIRYKVYVDTLPEPLHYEVILYKQITPKGVNFYVDLLQPFSK